MDFKVAITNYLNKDNNVKLLDIVKSCIDSTFLHFDLISNKGLKKIYDERLKICNECPIFINGHCGDGVTTELKLPNGNIYKGCGCLMVCKASRIENSCSAGKW